MIVDKDAALTRLLDEGIDLLAQIYAAQGQRGNDPYLELLVKSDRWPDASDNVQVQL
jgi:hypothetical protein